MEYHVDGFDEPTTFRAGTSLLVSGPSGQLDGQILDVVTPRGGERAVAITTNRDASTVLDELRSRGASADQVGVIDCTGAEGGSLDCPVGRVHSPGDSRSAVRGGARFRAQAARQAHRAPGGAPGK